jgi:hypothetical protein
MDKPVRGSAIPGRTGRRSLGRNPCAQCPAAITLQQALLKAPGIDHRRITDRVDSRGNRTIDLAEGNLVAEQDRRLQAGAAGALQIEPRRFRGKTRAERRFPRQIPLARVFHDRARRHVVQTLALQPVTLDHAAQRGGQHLLIAHVPVGTVAARKWNAHPAHNRDASRICSDQHSVTPEK